MGKRVVFYSLIGLVIYVLLLGNSGYHKAKPYVYPEFLHFPKMIPTDNSPTIEGVALGRYLFYDPILSRDCSISCGSCHKQRNAFSDSPNAYSVGVNGVLGKRNVMPLFNLVWYSSFHWDGKAHSIEEQVILPVRSHSEMDLDWKEAAQRIRNSTFYVSKFQEAFGHGRIDSVTISRAIAQFERTLISHNSKYDRVLRGEAYFTSKEYAGFILMNDQTKGDCLHCHTTDANALGTTAKFSNNGLDSVFRMDDYADKGKAEVTGQSKDVGQFRIPSLRNVVVTAPYMHDGRFQTLEEVLDFYSEGVHNSYNIDSKMGFAHQGGPRLSKDEKEKIISFLKTMTDSTFLTNPEFGNPFMTKE